MGPWQHCLGTHRPRIRHAKSSRGVILRPDIGELQIEIDQSDRDLQSYPVLPPPQQRQYPLPYLQAATAAPPPTRTTRTSRRRISMSTVHTPKVTPPRPTRPSPSALPPPPPTAGRIFTPGLENGSLPSEETDSMIADQPVSHYIDPEALKEVLTGLSTQATSEP